MERLVGILTGLNLSEGKTAEWLAAGLLNGLQVLYITMFTWISLYRTDDPAWRRTVGMLMSLFDTSRVTTLLVGTIAWSVTSLFLRWLTFNLTSKAINQESKYSLSTISAHLTSSNPSHKGHVLRFLLIGSTLMTAFVATVLGIIDVLLYPFREDQYDYLSPYCFAVTITVFNCVVLQLIITIVLLWETVDRLSACLDHTHLVFGQLISKDLTHSPHNWKLHRNIRKLINGHLKLIGFLQSSPTVKYWQSVAAIFAAAYLIHSNVILVGLLFLAAKISLLRKVMYVSAVSGYIVPKAVCLLLMRNFNLKLRRSNTFLSRQVVRRSELIHVRLPVHLADSIQRMTQEGNHVKLVCGVIGKPITGALLMALLFRQARNLLMAFKKAH